MVKFVYYKWAMHVDPKLNTTKTSLRNHAQWWPWKTVYLQIKQEYYNRYTTTTSTATATTAAAAAATTTTTTTAAAAAAAADIRKMSYMSKDFKRRQTASCLRS